MLKYFQHFQRLSVKNRIFRREKRSQKAIALSYKQGKIVETLDSAPKRWISDSFSVFCMKENRYQRNISYAFHLT